MLYFMQQLGKQQRSMKNKKKDILQSAKNWSRSFTLLLKTQETRGFVDKKKKKQESLWNRERQCSQLKMIFVTQNKGKTHITKYHSGCDVLLII